ncbi:MAG: hypothetical protein COA39_004380 [Sulfurimonas sp.]|nr:hypothetical protein [Sulfurimonas sp.]
MKYIYKFIFLVLLFSSTLAAKESGFSISGSLVGMSMNYTEYGVQGEYNAPKSKEKFLDSEKSTISGIIGGEIKLMYTKVLTSKNYAQLGVKMMYLEGNTDYDGFYLVSGKPAVGITKNKVLDTDIDYLFTLVYSSGLEVSYGMGLGYRSWRRELRPSQVEVYSWYSIRPKIGVGYNFYKFHVGAIAEYQYGINTQMSVNNPDLVLNLGAANIARLTIPLKYKINSNWEIFAEYVVDLQIIEKSDLAYFNEGTTRYQIWEPRSEAYNHYLKLGAIFKF